ncbi:unnamed protein product [Symbiodinium sp. CCMP2592]|nr:unnamed protein product [Symbiodinium sp. CCMP2592]
MTEEPTATGFLTRLSCPTDGGASGAAGSICYIGTLNSSISAGFNEQGRYVAWLRIVAEGRGFGFLEL